MRSLLGIAGASVLALARERYPPLELVTVTNDANRAHLLLQSSPLPVRVLGPLGQDVSILTQFAHLKELHVLLHVRDLVKRGLGRTVVIVLDAWDTVHAGCDRDLLRAFKALRRPLFFSAELALYPWGAEGYKRWRRMAGRYPSACAGASFDALPLCSAARDPHRPCRARHRARSSAHTGNCSYCVPANEGGGYRFLNSGCWGGYAWAMEKALLRYLRELELFEKRLSDNYGSRSREEEVGQILWAHYIYAHREEVALDYGASICLSLHGLNPRKDLVVRRASRKTKGRRRLFAVPFGKEVCFLHGQGGSLTAAVLRKVETTPQMVWLGPQDVAVVTRPGTGGQLVF